MDRETPRIIIADSWHDCEHLLGEFLGEEHYDEVIDEDCDLYTPQEVSLFGGGDDVSEDRCIFKFRKGFFTDDEQIGAYEGLRDAATSSQNRGLAAGTRSGKCNNRVWVTERQLAVLEEMKNPKESVFGENPLEEAVYDKNFGVARSNRGQVWLMSKVGNDFDFEKWAEETIKLPTNEMIAETKRISECISKTTYANEVYSGISGWFDRYPRIPYGRPTSYTRDNPEKFAKSYPFLQKLAKGFAELLPERYENQKECCRKIDPAYYVPETPFTTITVNRSFRTAAHRDAGDLKTGFSNLSVITNKEKVYTGGYLILPEFRVAINIRPGDLLLINNHAGIHGNSPIFIDDDGERISLVCYFREGMLELGEKEYEDLRYEFVEERRNNKDHRDWRPLWNGISPGMWSSKEWYTYLDKNGGRDMLVKYHPESVDESSKTERIL